MIFGAIAPALLKHFFIHEKYSQTRLNKEVTTFLERHRSHIKHLRYSDWKTRMTSSSWERMAEAFSETLKASFLSIEDSCCQLADLSNTVWSAMVV